ncbi:MAG TPA: hypothetical protein VGM64_20370 [Lacunisphaera sp.]|jgi:hypothetical protein
MNNSQILPALIVPLILWRVYRRVHRNMGRQKFNEKRTWISITFITLVLLLAAWGTWRSGFPIWPLGAGLAGGLLLTGLSHRLTRFEHGEDGHFYTLNPYFGATVSLLLIGRVIYRLLIITQTPVSASTHIGQSPVTLVILGLTFGYYLASGIFLMYEFSWSKKSRILRN